MSIRPILRRWVRRKAFVASCVVLLAVGSGSAVGLYSVIDTVLLKPAPWPDPERLVVIHAVRPDRRGIPAFVATWNRMPLSWSAWVDLKQSGVFEDVGAWMTAEQILMGGQSDFASVFYASSSFFRMLGVTPVVGRLFVPDEDETGGDAVVISFGAWQDLFGGRKDIVGARLALAPTARSPSAGKTIVGVLPPGFQFQGRTPDFVLPLGLMAFNGRFDANQFLRVVARLVPGVSVAHAAAVAEPLIRGAESPARRTARVLTLKEDQFGAAQTPLWFLGAGASLLWLITCSTVISLLMLDGRTRRAEVSIRSALGATRGSVVRQLLTEYTAIVCLGSILGSVLAYWLAPILVAMAPVAIREAGPARPTVGALSAVFLTTLVLTNVWGLAHGLRAPLSAQSVWAEQVLERRRGHRLVVSVQFASVFVLVACAALLGQSVVNLQAGVRDFDARGLLVATIRATAPPVGEPVLDPEGAGSRLSTPHLRRSSGEWVHLDGLLRRLAGLPGVIASAGVSVAPFTRPAPEIVLTEAGHSDEMRVRRRDVTDDYFRTMGIPVLAGRAFAPTDRDHGVPHAVIVSRGLARQLTDGTAIGTRLVWGGSPLEVIGVVDDVRQEKPSFTEVPTLYIPNFRFEQINYVLLRTQGDVNALVQRVRETVADHDQTIRVTAVSSATDLVRGALREELFVGFVSRCIAAAALIVAAVGLFALVTDLAARRRREIALRMAMGANPAQIRRLMLRDVWFVVLTAALVGIPSALAASHVLASLLFGVPAVPVAVLVLTCSISTAMGLAAAARPVLMAARSDPMRLLRE